MAKCSTCCQAFCTITYVTTWLVLVAALVFYHISLVTVVPEMQDFPTNLREGIDQELGFERLEADSITVKDASKGALVQCDASIAALDTDALVEQRCNLGWGGGMGNYNEATGGAVGKTQEAFDRTLTQVQKVTNDQYLGTSSLQDTSEELNAMSAELDKLQAELDGHDQLIDCSTAFPSFCSMFNDAADVVADIDVVNEEIDKWTKSDGVEYYEDAADYLIYLHAAPYLAVIGALFFMCAWAKESCCNNGVCCFTTMFLIIWFIFFAIQTVIFALCIFMMHFADEIKLDDGTFNNNPTIEEMVDHVKENYPVFWSKVFTDLEDGLIVFYYSAVLFEVWAILIIAYVYCFCCSPYGEQKGPVDQEAQ